ncbi:lysophospholipid acyltransferase family protein [Serpentinimonas barnesii]|uniref:lysophospholipid acyltransferase family protein n=1 Tax=Serpentinimonas barnesii TaxID=1458427 RepID=UPI000693524E|nr:hypothetical protein [Serpentinimonas barnesii]
MSPAPAVPTAEPSTPPPPGPLWLRALAHLPLPLWRALGALLGLLLLLLAKRRRQIARRNLQLCFPEATPWQRRRWLWQAFRHLAQSALDRVWLWHGSAALVRQRVRLDDPQQVLQRPGPMVYFAPHFSGLDACWTRITLEVERPWITVYSPQKRPWLERWVNQGRARFGAPRLVSRRESIRPVLRGLHEGAALMLLPDMDLGAHNAVFVPFFGVPAATVTALSRYASAAQAPVASLFCRMTPSGYSLEVSPLWADFPSGNDAADAQRMNATLETAVRQTPGQYHWLHRRFKSRPPGQASVY